MAKSTPATRSRPARTFPKQGKSGKPGRPARAPGHARRQIVVDTALLSAAMAVTGRGQSDTVNVALAQLTENAAILEGLHGLFGAFPEHPAHTLTPRDAR